MIKADLLGRARRARGAGSDRRGGVRERALLAMVGRQLLQAQRVAVAVDACCHQLLAGFRQLRPRALLLCWVRSVLDRPTQTNIQHRGLRRRASSSVPPLCAGCAAAA